MRDMSVQQLVLVVQGNQVVMRNVKKTKSKSCPLRFSLSTRSQICCGIEITVAACR